MGTAILIFMIINFVANAGIIAVCAIAVNKRATELKKQNKLNNASKRRF